VACVLALAACGGSAPGKAEAGATVDGPASPSDVADAPADQPREREEESGGPPDAALEAPQADDGGARQDGAVADIADARADATAPNDGNWTGSLTSRTTINGIWGSGPADVWGVGDRKSIVHWDGTSWTTVLAPEPSGAPSFLRAWGSGERRLGSRPCRALPLERQRLGSCHRPHDGRVVGRLGRGAQSQ
jgi:hypothetical protein